MSSQRKQQVQRPGGGDKDPLRNIEEPRVAVEQ